MINFLNLEYFVVAAEELNFTKAAKRLFISQQSLSNHIAHMEKEFGVALFNRTTPLTLTYAGQRLLVRARTLLTYKDETYHELADIKDFTVGQLSIGLSHTRGRVILPHVLPAYRSRFPNIDLNILEGNTSQLETALLHGDVDLVIGMLPFRVENIETVPICAEEVLLVVSDAVLENVFGGQAAEMHSRLEKDADLTLLQNCPFILLKRETGSGPSRTSCFRKPRFRPMCCWSWKILRRCWLCPPGEWASPSIRRCLPPTGRPSLPPPTGAVPCTCIP